MAETEAKMIEEISGTLEKHCGKRVANQVMRGKDSKRSSRTETAMWVKGAIDRMDELVPKEKRVAVMEECGRTCCSINKGVVVTFRKRRSRHDSLDAFLKSEMKKPVRGTKLSSKGREIHFCYTPKEYGKSMRCYCGLVGSLPAEETISRTYCMCSVGFVKSLWEQLLDKPVEVSLIRSALTGSNECEFRITY